jgi:eukaryotic-like serine/threonine-protein kinase
MSIDPSRWEQLQAILLQALEMDPRVRDEFLEDQCGTDQALRREVQELLRAREGADEFLDGLARRARLPMPGAAAEPALEGRRLGAYQLVREIGRGGMGAVYLAERADGQFEKQVALKLLPLGLGVGTARERFLAERHILAQLEHPGIARLLDAGVADDGTPFFVMEYVPGEPITRYCERRRSGLEERIALFLQVCEAVEYAHRNLVVHRDLKPGNVLVGNDGRVKLLDFGIAKVLEAGSAGEATTLTELVGRPLTPAYASPEQVRGEPTTVATDVYALGALLYELLAGRAPFDVQGRSPAELERIVCTHEPEPPSAAAGSSGSAAAGPATGRTGRAAHHGRAIRGDLDAIVLMALRKEPDRRYPSVAALAADLRAYRQKRPVTARPDRWSYRSTKFVRRRPGVIAAMALAAAVGAGYATTLKAHADRLEAERDRARVEAERATHVTEFLVNLFDPGDFEVAGRDTITARHLVERGAANVAGALHDQPLVRSALASALGRIHVSLGLEEKAQELLAEALELQRNHGSADGELAEALQHYAGARSVHRSFDVAEPLLREALAVRRADPETRPAQLASVLSDLAITLRELGMADSAEVLVTEALDLYREALGEDDPAYIRNLQNLALIRRARGDLDGAEALYREVLARLDTTATASDRSSLYNNLAYLLRSRDELAEAESFYRAALEIHREVYGDLHRPSQIVRANLSRTLAAQGKFDEAEALAREGLEIVREHLPPDHWRIGGALGNLGAILLLRGDDAGAEPLMRERANVNARGLGSDHPWTNRARADLADVLISLDRLAEAEALLAHARAELGSSESPQAREARTAILEALERLAEVR